MYYDIHTHQPSQRTDETCIVNIIIGDELPEPMEGTPFCSYGIHPWHISDRPDQQLEILSHCLQRQTATAIGEAGLDKMTQTPMNRQTELFRQQVLLAEEHNKPMIIHCVKAWAELIAIKKEMKPNMPWIIHGFRGKQELAHQLLQQSFLLSFGSRFQPDALRITPPSCLLAETDETTTTIRQVYRQIASSLSIPTEQIVTQLAKNSKEIFLFP